LRFFFSEKSQFKPENRKYLKEGIRFFDALKDGGYCIYRYV